MSPSPTQPTAITTFVLRFWREWTGTETRWRGRIEHVESGQRTDFLTVDQMLAFLQQMGVTCARLADSDRPEPLPRPRHTRDEP